MDTQISADGCWMNTQGSMVYRASPGCGATTIGQLMHFGDTGDFFDGDIHWGDCEIFRWTSPEHQSHIYEAVATDRAIRFFSIRNPYTRCLSAFFDKVLAEQSDGNRYREEDLSQDYNLYNINPGDVDTDDEDSLIRMFHRFMLMVWDTNKLKAPRDADIHWYPASYLCRPFVQQARPYHDIVSVENFSVDMTRILGLVEPPHRIDFSAMPSFDEASGLSLFPQRPVEDFYDDMTTWIVQQVFWHDFDVFKYDWAPGDGGPTERPDVDRINAWFFSG